jgi:hypothetical protein
VGDRKEGGSLVVSKGEWWKWEGAMEVRQSKEGGTKREGDAKASKPLTSTP